MLKTERPAAAIQINLAAIFVSMELSRSTWLITAVLPGNGEKMSKYPIATGNIAGLFDLFSKLRERSRAKTGQSYTIITIQEAGLDGFWIHRGSRERGHREPRCGPGVDRHATLSSACEN
ncbi:hypothetical protein X759_31115 [Mesorhizobium sp. LSHC420B00]|nr:hypothetical protein X759_31115 [Mesorhizobium sp. LSHC420B00]